MRLPQQWWHFSRQKLMTLLDLIVFHYWILSKILIPGTFHKKYSQSSVKSTSFSSTITPLLNKGRQSSFLLHYWINQIQQNKSATKHQVTIIIHLIQLHSKTPTNSLFINNHFLFITGSTAQEEITKAIETKIAEQQQLSTPVDYTISPALTADIEQLAAITAEEQHAHRKKFLTLTKIYI